MRVLKSSFITLLALTSLLTSASPIFASKKEENVDAITYMSYRNTSFSESERVVINDFIKMQDKISKVLIIDGSRYTYNVKEIEEIVSIYDFSQVNSVIGSDYTTDSFMAEAIGYIDESKPTSTVSIRGVGCDADRTESEWILEDYLLAFKIRG